MNLESIGIYQGIKHGVLGTVVVGINLDDDTYVALLGLENKLHKGASETQYKIPNWASLQDGYEDWFIEELADLPCEFKPDTPTSLEETEGIEDWLLVSGIQQLDDLEALAEKLLDRYTDLVKEGILY